MSATEDIVTNNNNENTNINKTIVNFEGLKSNKSDIAVELAFKDMSSTNEGDKFIIEYDSSQNGLYFKSIDIEGSNTLLTLSKHHNIDDSLVDLSNNVDSIHTDLQSQITDLSNNTSSSISSSDNFSANNINVYNGTINNLKNDKIYSLNYNSTDNGSGLHFEDNKILPTDGSGNAYNGKVSLGSSNYSWKDLYLDGQVITTNYIFNSNKRQATIDLLQDYSVTTIYIGKFIHFKDSGGDSNYSDNENRYAIFAAVNNYFLSIYIDNFSTETNFDYIYIQVSNDNYSWTNIDSQYTTIKDNISALNGNHSKIAIHTGYRYVKFTFKSDGSVTWPGWNIYLFNTGDNFNRITINNMIHILSHGPDAWIYNEGQCGIGFSSQYVVPSNGNGTPDNGNISLGLSDYKWKDLYVSGTVYTGSISTTGNVSAGSITTTNNGTINTGSGTITTTGHVSAGSITTGYVHTGDITTTNIRPTNNAASLGTSSFKFNELWVNDIRNWSFKLTCDAGWGPYLYNSSNYCILYSDRLQTAKSITSNAQTTYSDRRIKTDIVDVPDNLALQQVRDLPCRYYNYKDTFERGTDKTIGYIAQEVKEVLPMAVTEITNIIPNEYHVIDNPVWEEIQDLSGTVKFNLIVSPTDFSDNTYMNEEGITDISGIKYEFFVTNDLSQNETQLEITGNPDNRSFTFEQKWNDVFMYGREVNDFLSIDKAKICALHHASIQEIDRLQTLNTERITTLETTVQTLSIENNELKTILNALQEQINNLKTHLNISE